MRYYKHILSSLFLIVLLLYGCNADKDNGSLPEKRMVLVYMVADNNLDYFAVQDINEMEQGLPKDADYKLLVYIDRGKNGNPSHPYLMEIVHDTSNLVVSKILQTYPEHNATEKAVFDQVLDDAFNFFPEEHFTSKGLVLWSHGSAWLPPGVTILSNRDKILEEETTSTKSFGLDAIPQESNMDIKELATSLGKYHFDFIVFDACFMSSIEVIYELRKVTDYLIASPTEILSNGFPYNQVVPLFFEIDLNVKAIADSYISSYNAKSGLLKSASIAVIKMNQVENLTQKISNLSLSLHSRNINKKDILQLDRLEGEWIYDLKDFLEKTAFQNAMQPLYKEIETQWAKTVIYENNTPFMVESINLERCNGVSTYIPDAIHQEKVNEYYKTLLWFKVSGYDTIFTAI